MHHVDPDIKPKEIKVSDNELVIQWPDEHKSKFQFDWLQERSFSGENTKKKLENRGGGNERSLVHWDSTTKIPKHDFKTIMNSDHGLYEWLTDLNAYGLTFIQKMPAFTLKALVERIGFIRETHYGRVFEVQAKEDPSNVAYTSRTLGLHVDLPYYQYMPGCQFLHCIRQSGMDGGENEFVDSFNVAEKIRLNHPEAFKYLTEVEVDFKDIGHEEGREFHKKLARTIIKLDRDGVIREAYYSNQMRDSILSLPLEQVRPLYASLKLFLEQCYDPENLHVHKMEPGECFVFDNRRILHGRRSYVMDDDGSGERYLQGVYIDWDEIWSKINVLKHKLPSQSNRKL